MNNEIYQFVLSVAATLLAAAFTIIAYFLKQWFQETTKQLGENTSSLTEAVNELTTAVALLKNNQGNSEKFCNGQHLIIDKRLNAHSEKLGEHSEAISALEVKSGIKRSPRKIAP